MNMRKDPWAEEEINYVGSNKDTLGSSKRPVGPYNLDDDTDTDFDFDDEPDDWAPPVTPEASANRRSSATAYDEIIPDRPAKLTGGTYTLDLSAITTPSPQPAPVQKPHVQKPVAQPQRREFPTIEDKPNRSLKDRLLRFLRGNQQTQADEDMRSLQRSLNGTINVVFVNRKGGVGKTLTTTLAGMTLADSRRDRVIAIDASPEGGELCDRVEREQGGSVRSLLEQLDTVSRYSHIRTHTSQDVTSLEVLGSDPNAVGEPDLTADEYRAMMQVLRSYYPIILTDCAQGLNTPVMEAVLDEADVLILVSEGADGMRSATWVASQLADSNGLYEGKYAELVDDMIVVVTQRSARSNIDMHKVTQPWGLACLLSIAFQES